METTLFSKEENFSFWKNMFLALVFFILTPVTLGISLFSLFSLKTTADKFPVNNSGSIVSNPQSGVSVFASLPANFPAVNANVGASDARGEIVKQYLEYYNSPLVPYAQLIIKTADKYSIDFRLITAIAQQESNLCKIIPPGSHNCWGWGITSEGTYGFPSFEQGIEEVSLGLKKNYIDKGYLTPDQIMTKYTPSSNGSWAHGVNEFMAAMQ